MSDPTSYWLKRTLRIIEDLEEALIECDKLEILDHIKVELDRVGKRPFGADNHKVKHT